MAGEDLGGNVIRGTDGRVSQLTARLAPRIHLSTVADCELDLIKGDGLAVVTWVFGLAVDQLLVVRLIVFFVEAGGKSKVGKFDVTATIQKDVIWFDVAVVC